jgi:hypothetical protein
MATPDPSPVLARTPFIYRDFRRGGAAPAAGELHIPRSDLGNRCLSQLVLEKGPAALPNGTGPVTVIVVKADPTLDDMLAATLAAVQLDGRPLPAGMRSFVAYATVIRQGLSPGTAVPLERSLAGLYKAIRWKYLDLTDADQGRRFTDDWNRLAAVIFAYAADGLDPFVEFPLPSWLFADDQLFLKGDRNLYLRDKLAGEVWTVTIPDEGAAAQPRPALLLRRPNSRLWKEWARSDPAASRGGWRSEKTLGTDNEPAPAGYHFLAVDEEGTGHWAFSTDPVRRISIHSLRDRLQAEELVRVPDRAAGDSWESLFDDTFVAAPTVGTAIPEADLIRLVKEWAGARTARPRRRLAGGAALAAFGCLILVALLGARRSATAAPPPEPITVRVTQEGKPPRLVRLRPDQQDARSAKADIYCDSFAPTEITLPISVPDPQAVLLNVAVTLPAGQEPLAQPITLTVNGQNIGDVSFAARDPNDKDAHTGPTAEAKLKPVFFHAGENLVQVRLTNDRAEEMRTQVRVTWGDHPNYQPELYLVAVGSGDYQTEGKLPLAVKDAHDLVQTFRSQQGSGPFAKVHTLPGDGALLNPTRDQLLDALRALKRQAPEGAVAWILISGHGAVTAEGRFHLVLAGAPGKPDEQVSWDDVYAEIDEVRCPVIVLLDTCYSGRIHTDVSTLSRLVFGKHAHLGRVLISASSDQADDSAKWGEHSAMCLACLECLSGKYLSSEVAAEPDLGHYAHVRAGRRLVTLEDLRRYLEDRVAKLYELRGGVRTAEIGVHPSPGLKMTRIAVAGGPN